MRQGAATRTLSSLSKDACSKAGRASLLVLKSPRLSCFETSSWSRTGAIQKSEIDAIESISSWWTLIDMIFNDI